jgi:hypothetical protein
MSIADSTGRRIEAVGSLRGEMPRRWATGFLIASYGIGTPVVAALEYRFGSVSTGLGLPQDVIFLAAAVQLCASVALLLRNAVNLGTALLTVISLGTAAANFRAGWFLAGVAAVAYTLLQVWLGLVSCGGLQATRSCGDA